ncbi:MAG: HIT family protein [Propionibacteriaceae bacterium]|jgi:histidine triad (HIT) family protein|nr:HIT family protein [Propionibacteriaceae bacterium]
MTDSPSNRDATEPDCLFCQIASGRLPAKLIWSDDQAVAFLDINPWHRGHSLVIPRRHLGDGAASPQAWHEVAAGLTAVAERMKNHLGASGINYLSNAGAAAGQEVFHFHVHVIPRYDDQPGMARLMSRDPAAAQDLDALAASLAD